MRVHECEDIFDMGVYIDDYVHKKRLGLLNKKPTQHDITVLKHCDYWIDWAAMEISMLRAENKLLNGQMTSKERLGYDS